MPRTDWTAQRKKTPVRAVIMDEEGNTPCKKSLLVLRSLCESGGWPELPPLPSTPRPSTLCRSSPSFACPLSVICPSSPSPPSVSLILQAHLVHRRSSALCTVGCCVTTFICINPLHNLYFVYSRLLFFATVTFVIFSHAEMCCASFEFPVILPLFSLHLPS